ncbi:MAG: toll/interleukin-1 receptor domain-containing protein [Pseudomonadota bacterium]
MNDIQRKIIKRMIPLLLASLASIFSMLIFLVEFRTFASLEILIGILGAFMGVAVAYLAAKLKDATNAPKIFISYAHEDKEFVKKLHRELQELPFVIWWDQQDIQVGDDIRKKVDEFLKDSDYLLFVNSQNSFNSDWATAEIKKALELKKKILPVVTDDSLPPDIIKNILYADFSNSFDEGMNRLVKALKSSRHNKSINQTA